jgi:outer membrane protein assembly factor BamD
MIKKYIIILVLLVIVNGCSKEEAKVIKIKETKQDLEMISAYEEAYQALDLGDPYFAAKKFLEAELLYPQSNWAPKAALLASYSYYLQNYYMEALSNLERYLATYPSDKNHSYAHYLIAMCYYETIEDEKRDSASLIKAREKFTFVVESFPNTDFALDQNLRLT